MSVNLKASMALAASILMASALPASAVVVLTGTNPTTGRNESAPTGALLNSGWQWQGDYGGYSGTPIAPNWFISAQHVYNLQSGTSTFTLGANTYNIVSSIQVPNTDLRLFQVSQTFSSYASIYNPTTDGALLTTDTTTQFGRGFQRGAVVSGRGWYWGTDDAVRSWGTNTIDAIVNGGPSLGALLVTDFDNNGDPDQSSLTARDSGGGMFVKKNGVWKLVGVHYGTDYNFTFAQSGGNLRGTLFDKAGLYQYLGDVNNNSIVDAGDYYSYPTAGPQPQESYISYVSATTTLQFINSKIPEPTSLAALGVGAMALLRRRRF